MTNIWLKVQCVFGVAEVFSRPLGLKTKNYINISNGAI